MDEDKQRKEKIIFDELKKRMKNDMNNEMYEDDNLFYRFLRARDFEIDKAEKMLREHLEWRKKFDVENISKWKPPEVLAKYFPFSTVGFDKEGCLVKYIPYGEIDIIGLIESCKPEDWTNLMIQIFEEDNRILKRQSEKLGRTVDKVVYIENMEHFSLTKSLDKRVMSNMIESNKLYMDNYPETMKSVYVFNAPVYFSIFFSVVKAFVPSQILKKVKIYSDDSYKTDLLEVIDADVLPAFLGGKKTDPDGNPLCLTSIRKAEPVPEKYYLNKSSRSFPTLADGKKLTVSKSSTHEVLLEVIESGTDLDWEFELKSGDIKFGLTFQNDKGDKTELLPLCRINTEKYTASGIYRCEKIGSYILIFDNSFSLLRSKEI